jgi:hypothetical protein
MAVRRGVACSGVAGVFEEEADILGDCLRCMSMCGCARDTGSQGVGRQLLLLDWRVLRSSSGRADYMYVYAWYFVPRRPAYEWWMWWYLQGSEG